MSPAAAAEVARDLYERHAPQVYSLCLRRLGSREEAEDAAQTVFLNAVGALQRGSRPRFEKAWLRKIAENVCYDRYARNLRTHDLDSYEDVLASPEREPGVAAGLGEALAALPRNQQRAIVMREWHGMSYREIGAELGVSEAAAEAVAFRARRTLADHLRGVRSHLSLLGWLKPALGGSTTAAKLATVAGVVAVGGGSVAGYAVTREDQPQPAAPSRSQPARDVVVAPVGPAASRPAGAVVRRGSTPRPAIPRGRPAVDAALPVSPGPTVPAGTPAPATAPEAQGPTSSSAPAGTTPESELPVKVPEAPVSAPDLPLPELPVDVPELPVDIPELPVDVPDVPVEVPVEAPDLPVDVPDLPSVEPPTLPGVEDVLQPVDDALPPLPGLP